MLSAPAGLLRRAQRVVAAVVVLALVVSGPVGAGEVDPVGPVPTHGDLAGLDLDRPVVGVAATPTGGGYWLVADDGGVFAFGDAGYFGSAGGLRLDRPVVGMAATPTGGGYWLVADDGGVFAFGDAGFFGSTGGLRLVSPVVGMAATPNARGYWLVAADGGVFAFGDARFAGSIGGAPLARPVVGMAATPTGDGYWLAARDGGVFAFGDAEFRGSPAGGQVAFDVVGIEARLGGYRLTDSAGGQYVYSAAQRAVAGPSCRVAPVVGVAAPTTVGVLDQWQVTSPFPVSRPPRSARASGIDGDEVGRLLRHAQACQADADPPPFADPVPGARRSSRFGLRRHPIWGVVQLHAGLDLAAPAGTPIVAAADGVVVTVEQRTAYGTVVVIDHGDRWATAYAHLSSVGVVPGETVTAGAPIGRVGATGFATGAHLHVEVRRFGEPLDPEAHLAR